jgi:hypothetical protein
VLAAAQVQTQENRAKLTYVAWADGLDAMLPALSVVSRAERKVCEEPRASLRRIEATYMPVGGRGERGKLKVRVKEFPSTGTGLADHVFPSLHS